MEQHAPAVFQEQLQSLVRELRQLKGGDALLPLLAERACPLLGADRLTVYVLSADQDSIIATVKTGLNDALEISLPVSEQSIAGYCALHRQSLNIANAYDAAELARYSPDLQFRAEIDQQTGYQTRQVLACPILRPSDQQLVGVLQLINQKHNLPFPLLVQDGAAKLCHALADILSPSQSA